MGKVASSLSSFTSSASLCVAAAAVDDAEVLDVECPWLTEASVTGEAPSVGEPWAIEASAAELEGGEGREEVEVDVGT